MLSVPRFHMASVFGVRPGHDFLLVLSVEGGNLKLCCENPPEGTRFNADSGTLTGRISRAGTVWLKFRAQNSAGSATCRVLLIAGEGIQLTPPMGWNSWYCFSEGVSDSRIRETAHALVERGLAAHGWNFINIDDCWQGERGGKYGALQGNERFPDMPGLVDYVHRMGLRFGIYSTPWISTYAGFRGGSTDGGGEERFFLPESDRLQQHQVFGRYPGLHRIGADRTGSVWRVEDDVRQWAEWGVDLVKMDWYPNDLPTVRRIAADLRGCGRDIVLSLSNNAAVDGAAELFTSAQMCRITGDIRDEWESVAAIGFDHPALWRRVTGPGRYPDPDMLQIGAIGIPNSPNPKYTPTRLTAGEQRLQFTLWCLLSAPLLLSCDIAGMDDETFRLLTNDDLIAINQDPLAEAPRIEDRGNGVLIYRKALADGTEAIGLFNRSGDHCICRLDHAAQGRDLWDGEFRDLSGDFPLPPHSTRIFRTTGAGVETSHEIPSLR